jgi:hypothetical protein
VRRRTDGRDRNFAFSIALTKGSSCSQSDTLSKCCWSFESTTTPRNSRYEAPSPIGQKAEPAAAGRSLKTAEAVTATGRGLRSAPFTIRSFPPHCGIDG